MAYPAKKPFGSASRKPFKKFDKKPFGFKSAYKKPYADKFKRPVSDGPKIRTATKIGEHAPKPFGGKPAWTRPVKDEGKKISTGWGGVAEWYHDTVEEKGSYQRDLILPNLLRLMDIKKGETVLDLACGEGFFSRRFNRLGARVIASDISKELIEIGKKDKDAQGVQFEVAPADKIPFVADGSVDKAAIVLALQNIENVPGVFAECARVLKSGGKLYFVINHPAFRIPKQSSWGWQGNEVQYRRIDRYLSELREKIQMMPGGKPDEVTVSFHRPLQYFVKSLKKNGFALTGMEEWTSDRKSQPGPRAEAENRARMEMPLFMFVEARKL